MGKYQGYDKYKDSGVEWLGEIPDHWEVKRLKYVCVINPSKSCISNFSKNTEVSFVPMEYVDNNGNINLEETKKIEEVWQGYTYFEDRDVIIAKITPCFENGKGALCKNLYNKIGFGSTEFHVLRAFPKKLLPELIYYLTQSTTFSSLGTAELYGVAGQKRVPESFLSNYLLGFPPLDEQEKIARFLDYKTKQIDELIAKKETLIEKLDEKRTALITHAVTKGLDVNVPMKDSGIEWLGEIPQHWDVKNLRYICEFLNKRRIPLSSEERGSMSDKIYSYYGASGIIDYVENFIFDEPTILIAEDGANLLSRSTPLAFIAEGKYWVNNHAHILKPFSGNFKYWANLLCIIEYDYWITGSAQPKLTKDNLGSIKLADPPLHEQQKIAEYLDQKTAEIEEQKAKIQQAIDLLKEYRTALITNAVTGKIDVRQIDIP
ncbi:restriction endonuclease subunit S [Sphaerospermopsis sp. FACHB-1194]|uniref:restriction endonuclease subunit S n=1 Tax=Sphaerospermopsis sp. FACHB-1194 TaxID=2692862 RepID=UPI0016800467|nr:restriction endonuclease subunit S [Sphaerospermopsis sp. FACHB-1194]MBD2147484.1 restriction endonuclease subunit S [Sphaerospermopsis sp. FACHB-1194]